MSAEQRVEASFSSFAPIFFSFLIAMPSLILLAGKFPGVARPLWRLLFEWDFGRTLHFFYCRLLLDVALLVVCLRDMLSVDEVGVLASTLFRFPL